ncbi:MAG: phosphoribosylamine--glycine ligase [Candidatus Thermoplasmatota archaeon]|nr:phosphoribosylamine--glycine ligase [Candidatus Thermoplasmatota archaeon]
MKVLVVGGGGREHVIAWKIIKSRWVSKVYCAPGNGGISEVATCVPIKADDIEGLISFVKDKEIDITIVGPEAPLAMGIVDRFEEEKLKIFGPSKAAARIESSKVFAKELMKKYDIPTADFKVFDDHRKVKKYIKRTGGPMVIKVDGLAAGKGAFPCEDEIEALEAVDRIASGAFKDADDRIIIEEFLNGEEASVLAFSDGQNIIPLESAQDHKRAFDGDKGPNTGGMGAYSPAPIITDDLSSRIYDEILVPTIRALEKEGCPYKGILYAGLMITEDGPMVIEFNCRFGDPEAQAVIPRMATDFLKPILGSCDGTLDKVRFRWSRSACVCVVMASGGYPGSYDKGYPIEGIVSAERTDGTVVFHAGTRLTEDNEIVTSGGRVLGVTATGPTIKKTIEKAYRGVKKIDFKDAYYRKDIGKSALFHVDRI